MPAVGRLRVPFVNAPALTDVWWLFALTPLWWLLGVEQLVWFPFLFLTLFRMLLSSGYRVRVTATARWLGLFLVVQAISALFIVESYRLMTFGRTYGLYLSAWMLLAVITHQVTEWRQIRSLVRVAVAVMIVASLIGLIGFSGLWRGSFTSSLGAVLPDAIKDTAFGGAMAVKSIGRPGYFAWLGGSFYRLSSIFNFSGAYASALAIMIPAAVYLARTARSRTERIAMTASIPLLVLNLGLTSGRGAVLAWILGGLFIVAVTAAARTRLRFLIVAGALASTLVVGVVTLRPQETVLPLVEAFLYARGPGSTVARASVYRLTVEEVGERPFFGWGTQRRDPRLDYPLGSHSDHLGVLYKFGGVGFLVAVCIWVSLWFDTRPRWKVVREDRDSWEAHEFLRYGRWIVAVAVLNGATEALDLDAITFMLTWLCFSLLVATRMHLCAR